MIGNAISPMFGRGGGRYNPNAIAYFNRVTTLGGSLTATEKANINKLVNQLIADGNWNELDRLWLHGVSNQIAATVSLVNPSSTVITRVNSPTFTAYQGFNSNATTSYLDTNYNQLNSSVKYTKNSASFGLYSIVDIGAQASVYMGTSGALNLSYLNPNYTAIGFLSTINQGSNTTTTGQTPQGLFSAVRTASNVNYGYKNSNIIVTDSIISQNLENYNFYILCRNLSGAAANFTTNKISLTYIGSGSINQGTFYTAIQNFAIAQGFNV